MSRMNWIKSLCRWSAPILCVCYVSCSKHTSHVSLDVCVCVCVCCCFKYLNICNQCCTFSISASSDCALNILLISLIRVQAVAEQKRPAAKQEMNYTFGLSFCTILLCWTAGTKNCSSATVSASHTCRGNIGRHKMEPGLLHITVQPRSRADQSCLAPAPPDLSFLDFFILEIKHMLLIMSQIIYGRTFYHQYLDILSSDSSA